MAMLANIFAGFFSGAVVSIPIAFGLEWLVAPDSPDVPYGSMMPILIFYLGIIGAIIGAMANLVSRKRKTQAAVTGVIGGSIVEMIMLSFWLNGPYSLFHYSNVIIFMPVVIASGLLVISSIALAVRVVLSEGRNTQ